jgi:hypothetical protein
MPSTCVNRQPLAAWHVVSLGLIIPLELETVPLLAPRDTVPERSCCRRPWPAAALEVPRPPRVAPLVTDVARPRLLPRDAAEGANPRARELLPPRPRGLGADIDSASRFYRHWILGSHATGFDMNNPMRYR